MIVRLVDIGGMFDYHSLNFLFIMSNYIIAALTSFRVFGGRRGRDRMVVGFTTTYMYAISAYHH